MSAQGRDGVTGVGWGRGAILCTLPRTMRRARRHPPGATLIETSAFYGCASLASARIPSSVTAIGERAFYGYLALESVTVEAEVPPRLGLGAIMWCDKLERITVSRASRDAYRSSSDWSDLGILLVSVGGGVQSLRMGQRGGAKNPTVKKLPPTPRSSNFKVGWYRADRREGAVVASPRPLVVDLTPSI